MDATQVWRAALDRIRLRVTPAVFSTWFRDTAALELAEDVLVVGTASSFGRAHLEQRFAELARIAVSEAAGRSMRLNFVVRPATLPPVVGTTPAPQAVTPRPRPKQTRRPAISEHAAPARAPHVETNRPAQPPLLPLPSAWPRHDTQPVVADRSSAASAAHEPASEPTHPPLPHHAPATPILLATAPDNLLPAMDLNPRYSFETFVEGTANRFAWAAAHEIMAAPGLSYNPLVITGGVGLGKTHLLHAIGHRLRKAGLAVAYVTTERFMNELLDAIRQHAGNAFRRRYRTVDVLLVDDIQFVAGKETTELEFLHTFNALYDLNRQIVLTSDVPPAAMRTLHLGLRSRFSSGLVADLQVPDRDLRLAILRAKSLTQGLALPEEVLACLAEQPFASIRELEGALTAVAARVRMLGAVPSIEQVTRLFSDAREEQVQRSPLAPEEVLAAVARHHEVELASLRGSSRERHLAWVRQVAMYVLRELTTASHQQVGALLGGRDHTTVMHGCQRVEETMRKDERIRQEIETLCLRLRRGPSHG